jgi:hypothetical protein
MTSGGESNLTRRPERESSRTNSREQGFLARNQCGQPGPGRQENISYDVPYRCDAPLKIS